MPRSQADFDSFASSLSELQILELAPLIAPSPAIEVYPRWHFGIAEIDPDLLTMLRLAVWRRCHDRQCQTAIVIDWTGGLKVALYLGNDTSRLVFVGGSYEPNEFAFLNTVLKSGMVFLDIGANEGLYSLFAAQHVGPSGKVLAFEPSSREFKRLEANVELNTLRNVTLYQTALYDKDGIMAIHIADPEHSGQNTLGGFIYEGVECREDEQVNLKRLDSLAAEIGLERVDIIKIDAEGAEFAILCGAEQLLRRQMPILLLELSDQALRNQGSDAQSVVTFLKSLDYTLLYFDETTGTLAESHDGIFSPNIVARKFESRGK